MIQKNAKAITGAGAALAMVLGFYLDMPDDIVAALGVVLTGALVWLVPNKG